MTGNQGGKKGPRAKTRAEYSAINAAAAMIAQSISVVVGYIARIIFTHTLSQSYAGVNGLFTDVLGILALSELGIASAMNYALYRPVAHNDIPKIQAVIKLYRQLYLGVAGFVAVVGLGMLPFLHSLVGDLSDIEHIELIYLLYLGNSVASYLLTYRTSVISAHQREYIISIYTTVFFVARNLIQIGILLTTGDYIAFLLSYVIGTVLCNICLSRRADRMYPYLREKNDNKLPPEERREIGRNIRAMAMHKLGNVVVNNTDNLLISCLTGIANVGIYANYYLIISAVQQVLDQVFRGMSASVGNFGATANREEMEPALYIALFVGQWLYSFAAICLYELLPPLIELSFGAHYLFNRWIVLILCVLFVLRGMGKAVSTFWDALGMFWRNRYKTLAEAALNLGFSIVLGIRYGVAGIFLGTILSTLLVPVWMDPYLFYRLCLKKPLAPFVRRYIWYAAVIALAWGLADMLCALVTGGLVKLLVLRLAICIGVVNGLFLLLHFRREEFKSVLRIARSLLNIE